jgi:hypothetical protein
MLVALHAVDHAFVVIPAADTFGERAAVAQRAVRSDVEHADMRARRVVHVQDVLVRREAQPVRLAEVVRFAVQDAVRRDAIHTLVIELLCPLEPEHGHASVGRIGEVDRPVRSHHDVVRAVQLLALPVRGENRALARGRFHDEGAGDVLANVEIPRAVIGHAVALIARIAHFEDAFACAPPAADVARHVAEVEALLFGVPDRPLAEPEPCTELLDRRVRLNQLQQCGVVDFNSVRRLGHQHILLASSIMRLVRRESEMRTTR